MQLWVCPAGGHETCTAWITYPEDMNHSDSISADTDVVFVRSPIPGLSGDNSISLKSSPGLHAGSVVRLRCSLVCAGPAHVTLFDIDGRAVAECCLGATRAEESSLDLRSLRAGVYLVRLDDGHQSLVQKLVVLR
jgi:hypothetical protein